jgi:hypothetical protein
MEEIDLNAMNRKMRYYYKHKDDPEFKQRMTDAKKRYYQKNKEAIIAKSLERYYTIKATAALLPAEAEKV